MGTNLCFDPKARLRKDVPKMRLMTSLDRTAVSPITLLPIEKMLSKAAPAVLRIDERMSMMDWKRLLNAFETPDILAIRYSCEGVGEAGKRNLILTEVAGDRAKQ